MTAKFQIEFISTDHEVQVFARLANTDVHFELTGSSYLGEFPISTNLIHPKAAYKDGSPRSDLFGFTLKKPADKDKIKENDILELWDDYVDVIDSFKLSNGYIIVFLKCYTGKLEDQFELTDDNNNKWILKRYLVTTGSIEAYERDRENEKKNIFQYLLEPKGHDSKPIKGTKLRISKIPS